MFSRILKSAFITIVIIFFILDGPITHAKTESLTIDTESLNVRSGPGLSYGVTSTLQKGEKVTVLSKSEDWLEIKLGDESGWIASWFTSYKNEKKMNSKVVSQVNSLNVRHEPSTAAKVIGQMNAGDTVNMMEHEGQWARVTLNGIDGWVHTDFISIIENLDKPTEETTDNANLFTVAVGALNVRRNKDLTSKVIDLIKKGNSYIVKEVDGNWVEIELSKGKSGWVFSFHGTLTMSEELPSVTDSNPKLVQILLNGTNIRKEASTTSEIVLRANAGEKFEVISENDNWYELKLSSGESAFVADWVVSLSEQKNLEIPKKKRVPGTFQGLSIVIDPGHGGKDHGTIGANGTDEKNITLLTSKLLASKLKAAGANVILTRDMDTFIPLQKRVLTSHQHAADAFISVHYDSTNDSAIKGFTTYYTHSRQRELALAVNNGIDSKLSLRNRGAQPGNYYVIRDNRQNAILIELGFLSNPTEEQIVTSENFREQATQGIYNGLLDYFDSHLD